METRVGIRPTIDAFGNISMETYTYQEEVGYEYKIFVIYQIDNSEKNREYRCRSYEYQIQHGFMITADNYGTGYSGTATRGMGEEAIRKKMESIQMKMNPFMTRRIRLICGKVLSNVKTPIGYNGKTRPSLMQATYYLNQQGVLDSTSTDLIIQMLRIANRGVHGEIISQKYMEFASQAYPQIIDGLDNCKEWIRLLIDATVGS